MVNIPSRRLFKHIVIIWLMSGSVALGQVIDFEEFEQWGLFKIKDPFTDALITTAVTLDTLAPEKRHPVRLMFTCGPNIYGYIVDWDTALPKSPSRIDAEVRFDSQPTTRIQWNLYDAASGKMALDMADSIDLSMAATLKQRLAIRINQTKPDSMTAIFDISGMGKVVAGVMQTCADDME